VEGSLVFVLPQTICVPVSTGRNVRLRILRCQDKSESQTKIKESPAALSEGEKLLKLCCAQEPLNKPLIKDKKNRRSNKVKKRRQDYGLVRGKTDLSERSLSVASASGLNPVVTESSF
jgi:hypothetical protein